MLLPEAVRSSEQKPRHPTQPVADTRPRSNDGGTPARQRISKHHAFTHPQTRNAPLARSPLDPTSTRNKTRPLISDPPPSPNKTPPLISPTRHPKIRGHPLFTAVCQPPGRPRALFLHPHGKPKGCKAYLTLPSAPNKGSPLIFAWLVLQIRHRPLFLHGCTRK
jgi:hypothetical protein